MNTAVAMKESPNELDVFADRFFHFLNVWTVYRDLAKGKYAPSIDMEEPSVQVTMMFILCAFFHGLVEDSDDGLNGFRVWRKRLPREEAAIAAVEAEAPALSPLTAMPTVPLSGTSTAAAPMVAPPAAAGPAGTSNEQPATAAPAQ